MTEEREKLVSSLCDQIEELVSKIRNSNSEEYIDKVAFGIELAGKNIQILMLNLPLADDIERKTILIRRILDMEVKD
jgi:hypothetical protein